MKLLNVEADCSDYWRSVLSIVAEDKINMFVFWCDVEFEINGEKHMAVAQFEINGYYNDIGEWSEINPKLLNVSAEQDTFIGNCLKEAMVAMKKLRSSLTVIPSKIYFPLLYKRRTGIPA